jgi:acetylornithine deacetylase/succinyl-diaminopimelate desuccinylase-like protein
MHGTDERIAVGEYVRAVRFYLALLRGFGEATP